MTDQVTTRRMDGVPGTRVNPITRLSVEHPWWVVTLIVLASLVFEMRFPKIKLAPQAHVANYLPGAAV
jgi:hypothetical protein